MVDDTTHTTHTDTTHTTHVDRTNHITPIVVSALTGSAHGIQDPCRSASSNLLAGSACGNGRAHSLRATATGENGIEVPSTVPSGVLNSTTGESNVVVFSGKSHEMGTPRSGASCKTLTCPEYCPRDGANARLDDQISAVILQPGGAAQPAPPPVVAASLGGCSAIGRNVDTCVWCPAEAHCSCGTHTNIGPAPASTSSATLPTASITRYGAKLLEIESSTSSTTTITGYGAKLSEIESSTSGTLSLIHI